MNILHNFPVINLNGTENGTREDLMFFFLARTMNVCMNSSLCFFVESYIFEHLRIFVNHIAIIHLC